MISVAMLTSLRVLLESGFEKIGTEISKETYGRLFVLLNTLQYRAVGSGQISVQLALEH